MMGRVPLILLFLVALTSTLPRGAEAGLEFNYEVERRVYERINDFMSAPKHAVDLLSRVKRNDYLNLLDYEDKDSFASMTFSLLKEFNSLDWVYYGTERGMLLSYTAENYVAYKEPGDTYLVGGDPEMDKYHNTCVNLKTGEPENCTHGVGAQYISCVDDCSYILCPDKESTSCTDSHDCGYQQKWCRDYEIKEIKENDPPMGYVPRTDSCITGQGESSEERGAILQKSGVLGSCFYGDGQTRVQRNLTGNYLYCQKLKERGSLDVMTTNSTEEEQDAVCNDVFVGGFRSRDYDPRYRPWYTQTKTMQRPNWSPPYTFFDRADLGISYCVPFYEKEEETGRNLFAGVFSADYTFQNITNYLTASYPTNAGTYVVIFEQEYPNHLVASSTNRDVSKKVLANDETAPCPDEQGTQSTDAGIKCTNIRNAIGTIKDEPYDDILVAAYLAQEELGYPTGELVTSQTLSEQAYVSQSSSFEDGEDLKWTILIISQVERSETDALTKSQPLFAVVCLIGGLGFLLCLLMFIFMYLKRKTRSVILADWRFTLAFLLGCALLNLSSLTFLGENTEVLCMTRMWSFHLLFAITISPLFVKVYRMYRLVGHEDQPPTVISNPQAVAMTLPIVLIQLVILIVFTILDPPVPEATINIDDSVVTQAIECTQETRAFAITVLAYESALIFIGCVLSFMTRNLAANIGQSKELIFSMYNIAFVGIVTAVISAVTDIDAVGRAVFFSMGIFCATVFSSVAFVLPRIYQEGQNIFRGMSRSFKASLSGKGDKAKLKSGDSNSNDGAKPKSRKSGKTVSFGGKVLTDAPGTDAPITGWSAMEEPEENEGTEAANSSGMLGSKRFSDKVGGNTTTASSMRPTSGWSEMESAENDQTTNRQASKRFSSGSKSSIPRVSGWSEFDDNEDEVPGNNLHASKEFSDDEMEEPPERHEKRFSGWSEISGGRDQNDAYASRAFSDDEEESPQPSTDIPSSKSESWWEGPQNDALEVLVSNLEQEREEGQGMQSIEPSSSGSPASKENLGGEAGRPHGGAVKDVTETTMETSSRNTSPVSESSDKRAREKAERERVRVDHKANFKQREKEHKEHLKRKKAAR